VAWSASAGATEFGVSALRAQQGNVDVVAGQSFTLTTGTDTIIGTSGNDTTTGTAATYSDNDKIIDQSTTDSDTATLTLSGDATPSISKVENVSVTIAATSAKTLTASSLADVNVLTVTRSDVTVGTSSIAGNKAHAISALDASKVKAVTVAGTATDVTVAQAAATTGNDFSGVGLNADVATGNVKVTGAATVNAAAAAAVTGGYVLVNGAGDATQDAKTVTVNAAKAKTVLVGNNAYFNLDVDGDTNVNTIADQTVDTGDLLTAFTGAVTINAAAASSVNASIAGGGTINALGGTGTGVGIYAAAIDDSGVTINASYVGTKTTASDKSGNIVLVGGSGSVDAATVNAAGVVAFSNTGVEQLTLSGNGAAATYNYSGDAATKITLTGEQDIVLAGDEAKFDGKTIVDSTNGKTTTLKITTLDTSDLSKVGVDKIQVASNVASKTLTVASGANVELATDVATAFSLAGKTAKATVNVSTGDDTAASGATIDIAVNAFSAATNITTVNLDATVGKFTATGVTLATTGTLNITGTKNVTLGDVEAAKAVNAAGLTGALSMTADAGASNTLKTITSGSGDDSVTLKDTDIAYTVDLGDGDNTLTMTGLAAGSNLVMGAGADTVNLNSAVAAAIATGAGSDTVIVGNVQTDAIILMGDGTADELRFANAVDLSANVNYAATGVEQVTVGATGTTKISAASFAQDNAFKLVGTDTTYVLHVLNASTTAGTAIDASNVTFASTQNASLTLEGNKFKDTITGSSKVDSVIGSAGGDVVDAGAGLDTFSAKNLDSVKEVSTAANSSTGVVINLGATAVASTDVLAKISGYSGVTSVVSNTVAYVYGSSDATNSDVVTSLTNVENAIGSDGADYIVASAAGSVIDGGAAADYVKLGAGADTVTLGTTAASADTIASFTKGTDKLDLTAALAAATLTIGTQVAFNATTKATNITAVTTAAGTDAEVYYIKNTAGAGGVMTIAEIETAIEQGTAATGQATILIDNGTDTLVYFDLAAQTDGVGGAGMILVATLVGITGTTALATGDLISL
jgi:hypothetical protein